MENRIGHYGYHGRLVSSRSIGMHVEEIQKDAKKTHEVIRNVVSMDMNENGAQGNFLGCTV